MQSLDKNLNIIKIESYQYKLFYKLNDTKTDADGLFFM